MAVETTSGAELDLDVEDATQDVVLADVAIHRQRIGFLGWKPDLPDLRDHKYALSRGIDLPVQAWLPSAETLLPPIRDQGDQGACTGFSTRSAVQYKRALDQQPPLELSPRFLYYNARVIEGTTNRDDGAQIRDVVKGVAKLGAASEALCPYSDKVLRLRPSAAAYQEALTDQVTKYETVNQDQHSIKQAIVRGNPIVFGFTVYESFMDDRTGNDGLMRAPKGSVDGGHAVWMVGYDDNVEIGDETGGCLIGNSWGSDWGTKGPNGQRGYFWFPWSLLLQNDMADDFWALDVVS